MTPAEHDAAVALARRILHRGVKDGTYGVVYRDNVYEGVAAAEVTTLCLAVAERPTCATCRHWWPFTDAKGYGTCQDITSSCHNRVTRQGWFCADHEPTPLPSCSICRRDDCGGNHACE